MGRRRAGAGRDARPTSAARAENFIKYDHTILIGDLEGGRLEEGEPLVYARRRMDWLMRPMQ